MIPLSPWLVGAALVLSPMSAAQSGGAIGNASQSGQQVGAAAQRAASVRPIVNQTWTLANSPYLLGTDVEVLSLTIEAGVEVLADPGVEIVVRGQLLAEGTAGASIHFRNATAQGSWDGLRFDQAVGSSLLNYCEIEGSQSSGVEILNSVVFLTGCEIHDNSSATTGGGIVATIDNGDLVFTDCLLYANTALAGGGGIDASIPGGQLALDGCLVQQNVVNPGQTAGIAQGGGVRCEDSQSLYITGSTIQGNVVWAHDDYLASAQGGGLWVENTPTALSLTTIEANVLDSLCDGGYCDSSAFGGGLFVSDSPTSMTLCVVRENEIHGQVEPFSGFNKESCQAHGGGVYANSSGQAFEATHCTFAGNETRSTCKWNGSYAGGLEFRGNGLGSDLFLTNCVVARNRAVDGDWYAGGGGPILPGVMVSYDVLSTYQGGNGSLQNTIATENVGCRLVWGNPAAPCTSSPQPALFRATTVDMPVDYSIFENTELTGVGNLAVEPEFVGLGTTVHDLGLASTSPAIDSGNPAPAFNDVAFPPSQGGVRNDMGINGGPLAGGWALLPSP